MGHKGSKSKMSSNSGKLSKPSSSTSSSASRNVQEQATETDPSTEDAPCLKNGRGKETNLVGLTSSCYTDVDKDESRSLIDDKDEDKSP